MRRAIKNTALFLIFSAYFQGFTLHAYNSIAHKTITQTSVSVTDMMKIFEKEEREYIENEILKACVLPDEDEVGFCFKNHFYDPSTWFAGLNSDTAFRCMYLHFNEGIRLWRLGEKIKAVHELGRSMHYMQDMCCVVHLLGWTDIRHMLIHKSYEKAMDQNSFEYAYLILNSDKFNFRETIDVRATAISYSRLSKNRYKGIMLTEPTFQDFEIAYKACCELIYLFFKTADIIL